VFDAHHGHVLVFIFAGDSEEPMSNTLSVLSNSPSGTGRDNAARTTGEQPLAVDIRPSIETGLPANARERWWTRRDAAAYVHVSEATIGREVRRGRLRHTRVGGRRALRFRREWLDDWLTASEPVEEAMAANAMLDSAAGIGPRYIRSIRRSMGS
jgi:excisionase family DNA binding protein